MAATGKKEDLSVTIGADLAGLKEGLQEVKKHVDDFNKDLSTLGKAMSIGITAPLLGIGVAAVRAATDVDTAVASFKTLFGSEEKARSFYSDILDFSKQSGLELPGIRNAAKNLLNYGFTAQEVFPMLTKIGDAMMFMGKGAAGVEEVSHALGIMKSRGEVTSLAMLRLTSIGIEAWKYLADAIGTDVPGAMDAVEKKTVSTTTVIDAVLSGISDKYKGAMENQANTIGGIFLRLKDEIGDALEALGKAIIDAFDLGSIIKSLTTAVVDAAARFDNLSDADKKWILYIAATVAAIGPLILILGQFSFAVINITAAIAGLCALLAGPVGIILLIGAAVVAFGSFIYSMKLAGDEADKLQKRMNNLADVSWYAPVEQAFAKYVKGVENVRVEFVALGEEMPAIIADMSNLTQEMKDAIEAEKALVAAASKTVAGARDIEGYETAWKSTGEAIKETAGELVNEFRPAAKGMDAGPMDQLSESFRMIGNEASLAGPTFDEHKARLDALNTAYIAMKGSIDEDEMSMQFLNDGIATENAAITAQTVQMDTLGGAWSMLMTKMMQVPTLAEQVSTAFLSIWKSFTAGVGNALAQVLVYGQSLGKVLKTLMLQVAAMIIQTLVQIAIERIAAAIIGAAGATLQTVAEMKGLAMTTYAGAFSATAAIPVVGPELAPEVAAAALAAMLAGAGMAAGLGAAMGATAAAKGGISRGPTLTMFGEAGPEALIPLDRMEGMLGARTQVIQVYLDERMISESVVRGLPDVLRAYGVPT